MIDQGDHIKDVVNWITVHVSQESGEGRWSVSEDIIDETDDIEDIEDAVFVDVASGCFDDERLKNRETSEVISWISCIPGFAVETVKPREGNIGEYPRVDPVISQGVNSIPIIL